MLILSFSEIENDARVKKQVHLFADRFQVTSCGFGGQVREGVEHLSLADSDSRFAKYLDAALVRLHLYRAAYWLHPRARAARKALKGRKFDVVIANDIDTLGVALGVAPANSVHADIHEFFPGLHDQMADWVKVRKPFFEWILHKFGTQAGSATTVSDTIARRYEEEFGIRCGVVRNATPYVELSPTETAEPLRIVHSGGAQENRRIEVMMEAVALSSADVTLDLYLMGSGSPYYLGLQELAEKLGDRITMHPAVAQHELIEVLNSYDVGIHVLPRTNTNNSLALPNKFFDYVQARLALVIGPTEDMALLVEKYEIGAVSEGFEVAQVVETLNKLTPAAVATWKQNANLAAPKNSAESQQSVWEAAIAERLLAAPKR